MSKFNSPFMESIYRFMLTRRYSKRTIKTYLYWIRYYIHYHHKRHPRELFDQDVVSFLSHLAADRHVSASTQRIALNAIVFLYAQVLERPLGNLESFRRSKRQAKLPTVDGMELLTE